MPKRILITLSIIAGIGVGTGTLVMGILLLTLGPSSGNEAIVAAAGSGLLAASIAALVAHLAGAFRELDDVDR